MKKSLSTGKRTQQLHVFQLRQRLCLALSSLVRPFGQKGQMHLKQGQDLDENGELTTPWTNLNVCWLFQMDSLVKPHVEATNSDDMLGRQTLRTDQGEERELHLPPPFKWTASGPPL